MFFLKVNDKTIINMHQTILKTENAFLQQFHTYVRNVQPLKEVIENGKSKWLLTFTPVNQMSEIKQEKFDAVFVCNG